VDCNAVAGTLQSLYCGGRLYPLSPNSTCCATSRHDKHDVSYVSRMSCRACHACHACRVVLPDKRDRARHDFLLCQNSWATSWCDVPSGIWALACRVRGRIVQPPCHSVAAVFVFLPIHCAYAMSMIFQLSETMWHHPTSPQQHICYIAQPVANHEILEGDEDIPVVICHKCTQGHVFYTGKRCLIQKILRHGRRQRGGRA